MLIIGSYYDNIKCESFKDEETGRIRIRPLGNQSLPINIKIECRKEFRDVSKYPLGTQFYTENVKVCKKEIGRIYLRAKDQMLYKLS